MKKTQKSTKRTSLKVITSTWPISLMNAELIHTLGTVMELRIGITLYNTVLQMFHFRI
jgi:hypothetical protein